MLTIEQLDHVALTVTDLERSIEWYQSVLGLERRYQEVWPLPVMLCAGTTCLALFPADTKTPSAAPDYHHTIALRHVAFRARRGDFAQAKARFEEQNIPYEFEDHGISHSIYVYDPDGYRVELTTYEL